MNRFRRRSRSRRGALAPLAAVLMIPLLGMAAFSVDLGYLVTVQTELQNTADAASLAGAQTLMKSYVVWQVPSAQKDAIRSSAIAQAKATAKTYAQYNRAGGVAITLNDADIEVGYLDQFGNYNPNPPPTKFPNSVRVVSRRDKDNNTSVGLFFAPVLGKSSVDLAATARATIYVGQIDTFQAASSFNARVLPMTYDVNFWWNFIKTGKDPDGTASLAADGTPVLKVYPSTTNGPGNFGQLALDDSHAGASTIKGWIDNGMSPSDIASLTSNNLIPVTAHNPTKWDWVGDPGFKASTVMAVNNYVGSEFLLPLFKAYNPDPSPKNYQAGTGQGSHYYYQIVGFVPVRIMQPASVNREIIVQPADLVDPTAIHDTLILPAGETSSQSSTMIMSPTTAKLTQ